MSAGVVHDRADGDRPAGPILVVGSMRSGSTMLRLILDSHPHVAIGPETGFMSGVAAVKEVPLWKWGRGWYERLDWSEEEIDERLRDFYGGIFQRYAERRGKRRWGDKTPFHTGYIDEMARVFPDAVFVGIVRHPGAVGVSLRKNFNYTWPDAVGHWQSSNLDLLRGGSKLGTRFRLLRYEDLVEHGEAVLRELMVHVGEPWHSNLMEHHRIQRAQGAPRAVEGSTISRDPIDPRRAGRWVNDATGDDYTALQTTAVLARLLGYDPASAMPLALATTGSSHSYLLDGDDLAARMTMAAGDLHEPSAPPTVDASPQELSARLAIAEAALARVRERRAVRAVDAFRRVQKGRSLADVRAAWTVLRHLGDRSAGDSSGRRTG